MEAVACFGGRRLQPSACVVAVVADEVPLSDVEIRFALGAQCLGGLEHGLGRTATKIEIDGRGTPAVDRRPSLHLRRQVRTSVLAGAGEREIKHGRASLVTRRKRNKWMARRRSPADAGKSPR